IRIHNSALDHRPPGRNHSHDLSEDVARAMKAHRFIFTAALFAFVATNFPFGFVGVFARFPMIALLIVSCVLMVGRTRLGGINALFATVYLFLTYSFVTTFWTENVALSLAKWALYATVSLAF